MTGNLERAEVVHQLKVGFMATFGRMVIKVCGRGNLRRFFQVLWNTEGKYSHKYPIMPFKTLQEKQTDGAMVTKEQFFLVKTWSLMHGSSVLKSCFGLHTTELQLLKLPGKNKYMYYTASK